MATNLKDLEAAGRERTKKAWEAAMVTKGKKKPRPAPIQPVQTEVKKPAGPVPVSPLEKYKAQTDRMKAASGFETVADQQNILAGVGKSSVLDNIGPPGGGEQVSYARVRPESADTRQRLMDSGGYEQAPGGFLQTMGSNIDPATTRAALDKMKYSANEAGRPAPLSNYKQFEKIDPRLGQIEQMYQKNTEGVAPEQPTRVLGGVQRFAMPQSGASQAPAQQPPQTLQEQMSSLPPITQPQGQTFGAGVMGPGAVPSVGMSLRDFKTNQAIGRQMLSKKKPTTDFWNKYYKRK